MLPKAHQARWGKATMNKRKLRSMVLITMLALTVFGFFVFSARRSEAEINITPTLYVTDRNFLPVIHGLQQGPTVTATLPLPTITPSPTLTQTPTATATSASPPFPLPAPVLFPIENSDQDGNFTVAWSSVEKADYYRLIENSNNTTWETIYEGPTLSSARSALAPGHYCYNVRAFGLNERSAWAGKQCTIVMEEPAPEYVCEFETLYNGPQTMSSDIEHLPDGRLFITGGIDDQGLVVDSASIFDPQTRSFEQVDLPLGGGRNAAVLGDGRVMLTVYGDDPHTMIYDPTNDEVTRLETFIGCLDSYRILADGVLMTFCGSTDGGFYDPAASYAEITAYQLDIDYWNYAPESFAIPKGPNTTLLTNGVIGDRVQFDDPEAAIVTVFDQRGEFCIPENSSTAVSADMNMLYVTGGYTYDEWGDPLAIKDAHALNLNTYLFEPMADMLAAREGHEMLGLADGSLLVLGGSRREPDLNYQRGIDLYVTADDKWFPAGAMNIGRARHQAVQLANGEIFIYGGESEPGLGYTTIAPPEIGRCQWRDPSLVTP